MKPNLTAARRPGLYHDSVTRGRTPGPHSRMTGLRDWLVGDCTYLVGDCTGLRGDCTGLTGDCTGMFGDIDACELTDADRNGHIYIGRLVGDGE